MLIRYAIAFVSDMDQSIAFYRDCFGLKPKFTTPGWSEFETEGCTLALHLADASAQTQSPTQAGTARFGFCVKDLPALHKSLLAQGVVCSQEPKEQFGVLMAQYKDPDGMTIGISQGDV